MLVGVVNGAGNFCKILRGGGRRQRARGYGLGGNISEADASQAFGAKTFQGAGPQFSPTLRTRLCLNHARPANRNTRRGLPEHQPNAANMARISSSMSAGL